MKMLIYPVLTGLAVVAFARFADAQVPALLEIPAAAVEPDRSELAGTRRDLLVRLSALRQQVQTFNAQCANVVTGSPAATQCQQRQGQLDGVRAAYIVDADAFNARAGIVPRMAVDGQCPAGRLTLRYTTDAVQCRCDRGQLLQRGECIRLSLAEFQRELPPIVVEAVQGDVRFSVRGVGNLPVNTAAIGSSMLANEVTTGPKSSARFRFADGSVWIVGPNSQVAFWEFPATYNLRMRLIDLGRGMLRWSGAVRSGDATVAEAAGALNKQLNAIRVYNQNQSSAVLSVRGTQVMLALEGAERLSIAVVEGGIDLRAGGAASSISMEAGSRIVLDVNGEIVSTTNDGSPALEAQWRTRMQ